MEQFKDRVERCSLVRNEHHMRSRMGTVSAQALQEEIETYNQLIYELKVECHRAENTTPFEWPLMLLVAERLQARGELERC